MHDDHVYIYYMYIYIRTYMFIFVYECILRSYVYKCVHAHI